MVSVLRALASAEGFGIVAPDSRRSPSGEYTWEVGTEPDEVTEDLLHAQACLDEVLSREGVLLDPERLLSGGFSGGASTGPYVGTRDPRFTHCAVLHGGVFPGGLGENLIPCWFSTGSEDTVRSPEHVAGQAESMSRAGFPEVVFSVYPGGHEMIPEETAALAAWWLRDEPPTPWSSLAP
jgi:predicted esterase